MTFPSRKVDIRELGADPLGGGDIGPIIQTCFATDTTPVITNGTYRWQTTANVPDGKRIEVLSDVSANIVTDQNIPLMLNVRAAAPGTATHLRLVDLFVDQIGGAKTGAVCEMRGPDLNYDDNALHIEGANSVFRNFKHVFRIANASVRCEKARFAFNETAFLLGYNASFSYFRDIIAQAQDYFIYGDNELYKPSGVSGYDGVTNTLDMASCTSVHMAKSDVVFKGWDAINIDKGGFDLGGSGTGADQVAAHFYRCSNVNINNVYVSSDASIPLRRGLVLEDCTKSHISGSRFYTSDVGMLIKSPLLAFPASHIISENYFGGVPGATSNHCVVDRAKGVTITGNKFDDAPNRVGMNYPLVVSGPGNHYLNVRQNDFAGSAYALYPAGGDPGVLVEPQRWGVPIV